MLKFIEWVCDRITCSLAGHKMERQKIFYGPASSVCNGWKCSNCGHEQLLLRRWQKRNPEDDK